MQIPISWIKQYNYCKRRFALMSLDNEWAENHKIVEGDFLHERVNDPFFNEKRKNVYISRSVPVFSDKLNIYGVADLIEFVKDNSGVCIDGHNGRFRLYPLEYKNGSPEKSEADFAQLCAVALCLEEMFGVEIDSGAVFYGKIKRRVVVAFNNELRNQVTNSIAEMSRIIENGTLPPKNTLQNCSLCSLADICLPQIFMHHLPIRNMILKLL